MVEENGSELVGSVAPETAAVADDGTATVAEVPSVPAPEVEEPLVAPVEGQEPEPEPETAPEPTVQERTLTLLEAVNKRLDALESGIGQAGRAEEPEVEEEDVFAGIDPDKPLTLKQLQAIANKQSAAKTKKARKEQAEKQAEQLQTAVETLKTEYPDLVDSVGDIKKEYADAVVDFYGIRDPQTGAWVQAPKVSMEERMRLAFEWKRRTKSGKRAAAPGVKTDVETARLETPNAAPASEIAYRPENATSPEELKAMVNAQAKRTEKGGK